MTTLEASRELWDRASDSPAIRELRESVHESQQRVLGHPLYGELATHDDLVAFMELHVFAVWDFMSLLKSLQRRFTCIEVPWVPTGRNLASRLINEIVLVEESDAVGLEYASHFELYLHAMEDLGADTAPIRHFVKLLNEGVDVPTALSVADVPPAAVTFVTNTWDVVQHGNSHEIAAAFALTREDLIPEMFGRVITADGIGQDKVKRFVDYLERHIQVDAEEHTPMAFELLSELCGTDTRKWDECAAVARRCFASRYDLWSGVVDELHARRGESSAFDVLAVLQLPEMLACGALEVLVEIEGGRLVARARETEPVCVERCRLELELPSEVLPQAVSAVLNDSRLEIRATRATENGNAAVTKVPIHHG